MNSMVDLQWRYACKKFDPSKKLPKKALDVLAQAFNLTATSYGLQPCRLLILENKVLQEKMQSMAYGQRQVFDAPAVLVFCTVHVDEAYVRDYFDRVVEQRDTPREVLEPFQNQLVEKFGSMNNSEVKDWARNQAYIALGNLMTVCAQMRIDSCPMEGFIPEKVDELLDLKSRGIESVLLMPVGHRASDDMFASMEKVRLDLDDAVTYID